MTETPTQDLIGTDVGVGAWTLDPARTSARIAHKTMWGMVTVRGEFATVTGSGTVGHDRSVAGTVTVAAASIDTKNKKRDEHLRSAELLDAEAHDDIVVTVISGTVRDDTLDLVADLTIKNIREPIALTARVTDLTSDTIAATVTALIDRDRFGISWNKLGMMRGLTQVTVDAVFTRATP